MCDKNPPKRQRTTEFAHERLRPGHIRILQVTCELKRNGRRCLSTQLKAFHVKRLPHFIALSYAWAEGGSPTRALPCNNSHITISSHLYTGLSNLCPLGAACSVAIWIDAICIDQENDIEKSTQVPHMGSIYSLAAQVVIWLGNNDFLSKHLDSFEALLKRSDTSLLHTNEHEAWRALWSIYTSRWFTRLWVVQEICLARDAVVLCGRWFVSWDTLQRLLERIRTRGESEFYDARTAFVSMDNLRSDYLQQLNHDHADPDVRSVIWSLSNFKMQNVSKPVDRVYGLLSLLPAIVRESIKVDYTSQDTYWETYLQLGRSLVVHESGLILLGDATYKLVPNNLPSWCPDWNDKGRRTGSVYPFRGSGRRHGGSRKPQVRFTDNPHHVQIKGFVIDAVSCSLRPMEISLPTSSRSRGYGRVWLRWQSEALLKLTEICGGGNCDRQLVTEKRHVRNLRCDTWYVDDDNSDPVALDNSKWPEVLQCYHELISVYENLLEEPIAYLGAEGPGPKFLWDEFPSFDRTYFVTEHGRIGRGDPREKPGDIIVVLYTANTPFVLRYENGSDVATLVGEVYLEDCMDLDRMPMKGRGPDQWFTIG